MVLLELIGAVLPPGVLNVVNGYGREAGQPLAESKRIAKIAFTGSTAVGRTVAAAAAVNLIPATLELGGKVRLGGGELRLLSLMRLLSLACCVCCACCDGCGCSSSGCCCLRVAVLSF